MRMLGASRRAADQVLLRPQGHPVRLVSARTRLRAGPPQLQGRFRRRAVQLPQVQLHAPAALSPQLADRQHLRDEARRQRPQAFPAVRLRAGLHVLAALARYRPRRGGAGAARAPALRFELGARLPAIPREQAGRLPPRGGAVEGGQALHLDREGPRHRAERVRQRRRDAFRQPRHRPIADHGHVEGRTRRGWRGKGPGHREQLPGGRGRTRPHRARVPTQGPGNQGRGPGAQQPRPQGALRAPERSLQVLRPSGQSARGAGHGHRARLRFPSTGHTPLRCKKPPDGLRDVRAARPGTTPRNPPACGAGRAPA